MENKPIKIIIHHDGISREGDSFDVINAYHKEKWEFISSLGFYVGYQYIIEKTGAIRQARADNEEGAHTLGENTRSIGIMLAGNFDVDVPTWDQIEALGILLSTLSASYNIPKEQILPHRAFAGKSCFGSNLPDDWGQKVLEYRKAKLAVSKIG
mgnify:CR=1 FL=1